MNEENKPALSSTRRDFLKIATYGLGALIGITIFGPGVKGIGAGNPDEADLILSQPESLTSIGAIPEVGVTGLGNERFWPYVTRVGAKVEREAKNLGISLKDFKQASPDLKIDKNGQIMESTLVIVPISSGSVREAGTLRRNLPKDSWQIASTIPEIRGEKVGLGAVEEISQHLVGEEVIGIDTNQKNGRVEKLPGRVISIREDINHPGLFFARVQDTTGIIRDFSLFSLLVKIN